MHPLLLSTLALLPLLVTASPVPSIPPLKIPLTRRNATHALGALANMGALAAQIARTHEYVPLQFVIYFTIADFGGRGISARLS